VRQKQVVGRLDRGHRVDFAGCVFAGEIAEQADDGRLDVGDPFGNAVAQAIGDDAGVIGKMAGGLAIWPAAGVVQRLGQVPVM